jgi:putative ABC transport system permease protein
MRLKESFRFAVRGVVANRVRAVLTMLGIAIGVASVITLVAVGTGSQQAVDASYDRLGRDTLFVLPSAPGGNSTATRRTVLTYPDVQALDDKAAVPDAVGVAPDLLMNNITTQYGTASHMIGSLVGTTPEFLAIDDDTVVAGRSFTDADYLARRRDCVLGSAVAADLTHGAPATLEGRQVRLNAQPFEVTGVLAPKGYSGPTNLDDRAICTGTGVADDLHGYAPPGQGPIDAIAVQPSSQDTLPATQQEVTGVLDDRHHVSPADQDFQVARAYWLASVSSSSERTLTILLGAVAGISLLVGGIGVMNVMLISVNDRTREIGIRMTVGAGRRDIVGQFLGEAVMLSMGGGVAGVLLGFLASRFTIAGVEPSIAPYSVYLAFGVSLFTGLFFGIYPAGRAAALQPIEALRYE